MITYRCDHCGERIPDRPQFGAPARPERLRVTITDAAGGVQHFCSIRCATIWAEWAGYHKPPDDGLIDAEIYCAETSETNSDCRFPDQHPGDHVSYRGEVWS